MRIVSLIASATEIVCALGYQDQLVGRSHECDYPEGVEKLPECSEAKVDIHANAGEIDRQVKQIVEEALSVYNVKADRLKELNPDVIVTQDHCEVCAVSLKDVEKAVCDWMDGKTKIVTLRPNSLSDVWKDIQHVADALGNPKKGEELISRSKARLQEISEKIKKDQASPTVACIEWFDPLMAAGNWVPEFVELLNGINCFGEPGKHAPWMTWEQLKTKDPDIIITMPCGWDIKRSKKELSTLTNNPVWKELKAVANHQVYISDGNQYFNRPGPRLVESFEMLAEMLYPDKFNFGFEGRAFEKLKQ